VPYGTDSQLDLFQAINCLATITARKERTDRWLLLRPTARGGSE